MSHDRSLIGRLAAHESWAQTPDRAARTAAARSCSPTSLEWHLDRLPAALDGANDNARMLAACSARSAYYARLAHKSAQARRRAS